MTFIFRLIFQPLYIWSDPLRRPSSNSNLVAVNVAPLLPKYIASEVKIAFLFVFPRNYNQMLMWRIGLDFPGVFTILGSTLPGKLFGKLNLKEMPYLERCTVSAEQRTNSKQI